MQKLDKKFSDHLQNLRKLFDRILSKIF